MFGVGFNHNLNCAGSPRTGARTSSRLILSQNYALILKPSLNNEYHLNGCIRIGRNQDKNDLYRAEVKIPKRPVILRLAKFIRNWLYFQMVSAPVQAWSKEIGLPRRTRSPDFVHRQSRVERSGRRLEPWPDEQEEQRLASISQQSGHKFRWLTTQPRPKSKNLAFSLMRIFFGSFFK